MARNHDFLIQDLRTRIASGDALIIAGAGVSLAATGGAETASWTGLLKHGVGRCEQVANITERSAERMREEIDSGDLDELLSAAEKISAKLKAPAGGEYRTWLRDTIGCLRARHPALVHALAGLDIPIATTNYDGIYTEVTGHPPVTWMDGAKIQRVLRGDDRGVLHFHGHWERPESVILGTRSYAEILRDGVQQVLQKAVAAFKTLIFVGCGDGLRDPNFGALMKWLTQFSGSEYRHFRLALESEVDARQAEHPPEQRVFVLPFGKAHGDLTPFLKSLTPGQPRGNISQPIQDPVPAKDKSTPALPPRRVCLGREAQVETVVQAFLSSEARPVSVRGAPGIGKSTVVLAALHDPRAADKFGARRYFVRCDGHANRESLAGEIARVLKISSAGDPESNCIAFLESAPSCMVLDNFETPWDADVLDTEELLARLAVVPTLVLGITTRIRQQPPGILWQEPVEILRLGLGEARALFLSVAGKKHGNDPNLENILSVADGVPLALLLLGHLAEAEPHLSNLWDRWQSERTRLLSRGQGNSPQLNAAVSFELSFRGPRMTDSSREALAILAVLPGGLAHQDLPACLPGCQADISVLRSTGLVYDEDNRLRMLAPIREYVKEIIPANPQRLATVQNFFLEMTRENCDLIGWVGGAEALARLAPETANIETMLASALNACESIEAINISIQFGNFVGATGWGSESTIRSGYEAALRLANNDLAAECCRALGDISYYRSKSESSGRHYSIGLELYRQVGNMLGEANCISGLGDLALKRSDYEGARTRYEEARPLYRQVGNVLGEANCIMRLGELAYERSDYEVARTRYEEARPLFRQVGNVLGEANCIMRLGDLALERSDYEVARTRYEEARPLYRQVGDVQGEANCALGFGSIDAKVFNVDSAVMNIHSALVLYKTIQEPYSIGKAYEELARIEKSETLRLFYVSAAVREWRSIDRNDLVQDVLEEFSFSEADLLQDPDIEPEAGKIKSPA